MAEAESIVDVMGTRAHVVVAASDLEHADLLRRAAVTRLAKLEGLWSRFLPDSEISRLNRGDGQPVVVASETALLVERSIEAWDRTGGRFDPTVLPALIASGYDRDFRAVRAGAPVRSTAPARPTAEVPHDPAPGCADIYVRGRTVTLPANVSIDPGGIGKGLAADLVVDLLMTAGARGVCVNIGGDLRVAGNPTDGAGWSITIEDPLAPGTTIGSVILHDEALVSSWRTRRTWTHDGQPVHHVIDPTTGTPAWSGIAGLSVIEDDAWWAEALATSWFLLGADEAPAAITAHRGEALLVRDDGARRGFGRFRELLAVGSDQPG